LKASIEVKKARFDLALPIFHMLDLLFQKNSHHQKERTEESSGLQQIDKFNKATL